MRTEQIVTLPGDGVGPEVTQIALEVLQKTCRRHGVKLKVTEHAFGGAALDQYNEPVTEKALEDCKQAKAVLLGAVGGPAWDNVAPAKRAEAGLLKLRSELGVYANLRPIKVHAPLVSASSLKAEVIRDVDILIVRELTGGIYFGLPRFTTSKKENEYAVDTLEYSTDEISRLIKKGFEAATKRERKVHSVDKSNILDTSRLWRKTAEETAKLWPEVELQHILVDNCAMQLVRNPSQFDVIVTTNLFGDILSDEAAMLTGSIGMLPSASLGDGASLYEPVHGSAPDIAGQGKANPIAAIASVALLCRHALEMEEAATEIEEAIESTLADGFRTQDIYSGSPKEYKVNSSEMGSAILKHINPSLQPGSFI